MSVRKDDNAVPIIAPVRGTIAGPAKVARLCVVGVLVACASSCSTTGDMFTFSKVEPWQRGVFARDDMQLVDDALGQSVDDHIYFSREASTGGSSVKGGGCGCN